MTTPAMDETDRRIIHCLQGDARNVTTAEIGEKLGISGSTVANRITQLEESGIIAGYTPIIDYARSGYPEHYLVVGTVAGENADEILTAIPEESGVVNVTTLLTDRENVVIEVVADGQAAVEDLGNSLSDLGVTLVRTDVVTNEVGRSFNGFGKPRSDDG